ncbi:histidine phosphatase family protein [Paenibacillus sp. sgz500958]|uniref:histidine phosphatase family protein n=1 Tax=Paenibacillus sp. sgz500958 TaxID=3242475 RepID=UPI0036D27643
MMNLSFVLELVLLRHGRTAWNAERRYLGHTDVPLLPGALEPVAKFQAQPELAGEFWSIWSSDLRRCRETLASLSPALQQEAVYDTRLRELNFGDWEGCTYDQLKGNEMYRSWIDNPAAANPPGGEAWEQFEERIDSFMKELGRRGEDTLRRTGIGSMAGISQTVRNQIAGDQVEHHQSEQHQYETQQIERQGSEQHRSEQHRSERQQPERQQPELHRPELHRPVPHQPALPRPASTGEQGTPQILRVLVVTHGGVIRHLQAKYTPGSDFHGTPAPAPGGTAVIKLQWAEGSWHSFC